MESFITLCVLLFIGHFLRSRIKFLQWLYLPSCVIAGLVALVAIQLIGLADRHDWMDWSIPESWTAGWSALPGLLINVVFACLFIGIKIPPLRDIWRQSAPQLAYGQVVAWGQYVVGVGIVMVLLKPLFGTPDIFGAIVPVGFEGGHGTAGGLAATFSELGWPEGKDFGLASATMGMISAIVVGMIIINVAVRRKWVSGSITPDRGEDDSIGIIPVDRRPSGGKLTVNADAIESMTLHLVFVGLAVGIGYGLKWAMSGIETTINADLLNAIKTAATNDDLIKAQAAYHDNSLRIIVKSFPTFPLCMIGGLIVQIWEQKFDRHKLIDLGLTRRIQNASLDFLVLPAIAMIRIETIGENLVPFFVIIAAAVAWNLACVLFLAKYMLPNAWFERSIAEMGQSMGVTSTGLLLLRVVDPNYETPAANAFAYKQLLHEPFMGGGLWTSTAIPLLALWGGWPVLIIAFTAVVFWIALTFLTPVIRPRTT